MACAHYYEAKRDQAVLFVASMPILQKKKAEEIAWFDPQVLNIPHRQKQLARLMADAQQAYEDFPGLRRPKGKSGNTTKPKIIDGRSRSQST
ncbi:MAG: hypothetical protein JO165_01970 [Candidatus Eremiobacteraeota bacterium]|nr:hypothetical protein [Candidatus Eremiobacteraeota bacterium]